MSYHIKEWMNGEWVTRVYNTMIEAVEDQRIFGVARLPTGIPSPEDVFELREKCDDYFVMGVNRQQLLALSDELRAIAESPNGIELSDDSCRKSV